MRCPVCVEPNLVMTDRQGIEVDYCPQCRGVWLDRGELDKIIERAAAAPTPIAPSAPIAPRQSPPEWQQPQQHIPQARPYPERRDYDDDDDDDYRRGRKKKRGGFLGDIFDFS